MREMPIKAAQATKSQPLRHATKRIPNAIANAAVAWSLGNDGADCSDRATSTANAAAAPHKTRAPSAGDAEREHDRQRLYELDRRSEERSRIDTETGKAHAAATSAVGVGNATCNRERILTEGEREGSAPRANYRDRACPRLIGACCPAGQRIDPPSERTVRSGRTPPLCERAAAPQTRRAARFPSCPLALRRFSWRW
jgi:hypothetical protein